MSSATPAPGALAMRHVARAIGIHQAGHAEEGVAAEGEGIEEVVVDPAIDDVDLALAVGAPHVDDVVLHDQVVPLHQVHAHLPGQEGVLEEGGVVDPGREENHHGVLAAPGRGVAERFPQEMRIVADRPHRIRREELGEDPVQQVAVLQHVGHPARAAAVVLEDEVVAAVVADEVGAHDVGVDPLRGDHAQEGALELHARVDQLRGQQAIFEAALLAVDVADEEVQGGDALHQPALDALPFRVGDHPRHEVEGEDALDALLGAVDGEGDALVDEREFLQALAAVQLALGERL